VQQPTSWWLIQCVAAFCSKKPEHCLNAELSVEVSGNKLSVLQPLIPFLAKSLMASDDNTCFSCLSLAKADCR